MTDTPPPDPASPGRDLPRSATGVVAALLLVVGLWPWMTALHIGPSSTDAALWIRRGALHDPSWVDWVFASRHFVGYRPITALTYPLNYAVGGLDPVVYHLTDVLLHGLAALALLGFARALTGSRAGGLLAMGLFLIHPATEEVVPFIARRSYSLAAVLATCAVWAWWRTPPGKPGRQALSAVALLAAALLSNESTYVLLGVFVLVALHRTGLDGRAALRMLALPLGVAAAAFLLRLWRMEGDLGGYGTRYQTVERFAEILRDSWTYVWHPVTPVGEPGLPGAPIVAAAVAYYAWRSLIEPVWRRERPELRVLAILALWAAGYSLLYGLWGVWFWRGAYFMIGPIALLLAAVAAQTVERWADRPRVLALHLVPQAVVLASLLFNSPALRGLHPVRSQERATQHERFERILAAIEAAPITEPASVHLVLTVPRRTRHNDLWGQANAYQMKVNPFWVETLLHDRDLRVHNLALVHPRGERHPDRLVRYVEDDGGQALAWGRGKRVVIKGQSRGKVRDGDVIRYPLAQLLDRGNRERWVYVDNGDTARLWRIEEPE